MCFSEVECAKNAWLKLHKPDVYYATELTEFEQSVIDAGIEVEGVARRLFADGTIVTGPKTEAQQKTVDLLATNIRTLFQPAFEKDGLLAAIDVLQLDDDFDNSVVHIRRSVYLHEETTPKTAAGYRDVDIHPDVMATLKKHIGDRQTGLVFIGRRGKPLVVGNVNEYVLKPILKKLELPYGTTHAMRHGAVSRFQEAGVHGDLITKWVGHTSLKMTSKYTHFSAKHRKEVVAKLGAITSLMVPIGPNLDDRK